MPIKRFATNTLGSGWSGFTYGEKDFGHKTLIMVERYAHQNGEHINAAMDKLEDRYRKIRK